MILVGLLTYHYLLLNIKGSRYLKFEHLLFVLEILFPFFLLNGSGMILAFGALACSLHLKTEGL